MNLKIPCTSCSDWQPSTMCVSIAVSSPCCSCCCWPRGRLMSSGCGHSACRWLALAVFCTGHGPLQFPAEAWTASRAFYTRSTQLTPTPHLHILTVTQMCTPWRTHTHIRTYIYMHTNMYTLTYANTKLNLHIIIALSFVHYYDSWMHIGIVQFYFLPALNWIHTYVGEKKRRCEIEAYDQKLKRTLPDFLLDWAYYKPILVSSLFYPLHFVCMLSLSPYYFFPYNCFAQTWKR